MGREFELKYRAIPAQLGAILADFTGFREISMETTYYDTPERALAPRHWTLRRRMENGCSICTLKTPCEDGGRLEWETECDDILSAIPELIRLGAPEELTALVSGGVDAVCGARFIRQAALIELENATLELALDRGVLRGGVRMELMAEVEVELKSGDEAEAIAFARTLAAKYGLREEHTSKFRRALALSERR